MVGVERRNRSYSPSSRYGNIFHVDDEGHTGHSNPAVLSTAPKPESSQPGGTNVKTPSRSFYHRSYYGSPDTAHYASQGVREQTAELASLALSDADSALSGRSLPTGTNNIPPRHQQNQYPPSSVAEDWPVDAIAAAFEPETSSSRLPVQRSDSALTEMMRDLPPDDETSHEERPTEASHAVPALTVANESEITADEHTSLLPSWSRPKNRANYDTIGDIEGQRRLSKVPQNLIYGVYLNAEKVCRFVLNPKSWDARRVWYRAVVFPAGLLPAVLLGLLLNILDAVSYGMILFPLGEPVFAHLGADGISMFYVSTIISQLVFSCGASVFKGGIGSEMIEVVPFFHRMALMVLTKIGDDNPESVLATTILSFSVSAVVTGAVFFLMGACKLGSLIGFFPRHILIGCIGGVGWFLVATGVQVSARLPGTLEYNLTTLRKLFQLDTVFLWTVPLFLASGMLILKRFVKSNLLVGAYFLTMAAAFYVVKFISGISLDSLRKSGWLFAVPPSSNPWYHFYTLYDFSAVNWSALIDTVPAMFALTFFGVLHVPINVPALGISTSEDNLNVDRELIAHGVTNALSGFAGSVQNYLVYTNSLLFIDSGGNSRLAGIMLAIATTGVLIIGPSIIGYIPILVVGALIFMLGIELMEEALVDTWGRLHKLEYLTIVIIVVTMGAWDFVIGIFVGILLACVNFVVQTSRKSAIRAIYSGEFAGSTVRRHPTQHRFLQVAGQQTLIIKLEGFLFFGTIVKVESTVRDLIEGDAFHKRPIRFLVLDLSRVNGLDFSAAEGFMRVSRIIGKRNVQIIISGLNVQGEVAKSLQNVGLFEGENEVQIFEDLNSALEFCENEYLKVFYSRKEALSKKTDEHAHFLNIPKGPAQVSAIDTLMSSPRRRYLQEVAMNTLCDDETVIPPKWSAFRQPLPLLLQTFRGLTSKYEDFWFPACAYFSREFYPAGSILYYKGEKSTRFYLLESGMLRAEYEMPQGRYSELIVAGRPCGELPFFGETERTATVKAESDCVVWYLGLEKWEELRVKEPEIAQEILMISLKLTAERMESITSYVLTIAG